MIVDKHKGAKSEMIACAWLLSQGYEVFRNVSAHGVCDVIATKGTQILKIDIKSGRGATLRKYQIEQGVKLLTVLPNGGCILDLDPMPSRCLPLIACKFCEKPFRPISRNNTICSDFCREQADINRRINQRAESLVRSRAQLKGAFQ